jgi:hypothetical protein
MEARPAHLGSRGNDLDGRTRWPRTSDSDLRNLAAQGMGTVARIFFKKNTQNSLYLILFLSRIIKVATIDIQLEKSLHTKNYNI